MCGIAGFTHNNQPDSRDRIERVTRSIIHRGPDQQGVYLTPRIALGAARLQIIDLAHGDQPMRASLPGRPQSETVIVFNGEVYNHEQLRNELEARGHTFRSRCDTEVVLRGFLEWDVECFARLRGMFAAAIWNQAERRLVLVRDRIGIKPLYLSLRGRELYFGSELKTILLHPELDRQLDRHGLDLYLSLNYVPTPHTLVSGIRKLPPGEWLEWRDGELRGAAYWKLPVGPPLHISLPEAKQRLDALLRESVREHMMSDVPLGVWASGGLDSSTIVHYASQASAQKLKTFSVSFRGRSFDESRYFRAVADVYGTDHHEFDLNPDVDLRAAIEELPYYADEPSADAGALPVWFLSRMSRQHVTVALSGEGADELFGGYITYLADGYARRLRRLPVPLRSALSAALRRWPASDEKVSFGYKLRRLVQGSLLPPDHAHLFWNGTFSEAEKQQFYLAAQAGRLDELYRDLPPRGAGFLDRYLAVDRLNYLPDDILYKCDRMSMAHSLEVRPPFLDHRIVEFAAALPERYKVRGSTLKFLLRELMRDKLPRVVLRRAKQGFDIPAHHWLRTVLRPLLLETINQESIAATGLFRWEYIRRLLSDHLERRADYGYHLWGLMTLLLWIRRWNVAPTAAAEAKTYSAAIPTT